MYSPKNVKNRIVDNLVLGSIMVVIAAIVCFFAHCNLHENANDAFADKQYQDFQDHIAHDSFSPLAQSEAEYIQQFHYDSSKRLNAQNWLIRYNKHYDDLETKVIQERYKDSIKIAKMGKLTILKIDIQETKCNLTKGYYLLSQPTVDSSDLAFLVNNMATNLFQNTKKKSKCRFPVMSQAFVYFNKSDFINGYMPIAGCSITPSNYSGSVYINMIDFRKQKK